MSEFLEAHNEFLEAYKKAIASHGFFSVALSGGNTPRKFYAALADSKTIDWAKVQIFWSDERLVARNSPESNYKTAFDELISKIEIPAENIHAVPADLAPYEAAAEYEKEIKKILGARGFDLILLGIGTDGHTASLFPGTKALNENLRLVAANFVPKFNQWRITFTYPLINSAECVMFLADHHDPQKAAIINEIKKGANPEYPASLVKTKTIKWPDASEI